MTSNGETPEPLPLDKLVARWMLALGPEGSATHAGKVQVEADDLRRMVEALVAYMRPVFIVDAPDLGDFAAWEERFKLFSVPCRFTYVPFHEEGVKTQVQPRPFLRPALEEVTRKMAAVPMVYTVNGVPVAEISDDELRLAIRDQRRFERDFPQASIKPRSYMEGDPLLAEWKRRGLPIAELRDLYLGVVDMGTHAAELVGHFDETGEAVITDVAGVTTGRK